MTAIDLALTACVAALAGLLAAWVVARLPPPATRPRAAPTEAAAVFVLDGAELADATPAARLLLDLAPAGPDDAARILALLAPRFPGLAEGLAALPAGAQAEIAGLGGTRLAADRGQRGIRLTLAAPDLAAILGDLACRFRDLVGEAPLPIWCETAEGAVTWANRAAAAAGPAAAPLPPRPLAAPPGRLRQRGLAEAGGAAWYDRHDRPLPDGGRDVYAVPADDVVRAEAALRGFLQTLTRTFAHLPIGLAVFDADWRLGLFNPALSDLTGLPPAFLARRPTLHAVLDRLRELRMIPEPRDYAAWRRRLADIERAAEAGHYTELWPLPSGQTFRVTGQPSAEGGVALLLEDITADTARNRGLKQRADLVEAAFAALDRAAAVFGPTGAQVAASQPWQRFWGGRAADLDGALARCAALCHPTPFWAELRAACGAADSGVREEVIVMRDGRVLRARGLPLPGGALLVECAVAAPGPAARPAAQAAEARPQGE